MSCRAMCPAVLVALLTVAVASIVASVEPVAEVQQAMDVEDACSAEAPREECALSLRQLRGLAVREAELVQRAEGGALEAGSAKGSVAHSLGDAAHGRAHAGAPVKGRGDDEDDSEEEEEDDDDDEEDDDDDGSEGENEKDEEEEDEDEDDEEPERKGDKEEDDEGEYGDVPGVCCLEQEDEDDLFCGSCTRTANASDPRYHGSVRCADHGGTWCRSLCVMGALDPSNKCGTAMAGGIAASGGFCARDFRSCGICHGEWCEPGAQPIKVLDGFATADAAMSAPGGFCCYWAEPGKDSCGGCADVATDVFCSSRVNCGSCGGTWCAGPKCVTAFAKTDDPCGSALEGGVAANESSCAQSEAECDSSCKGVWCPASEVTYAEGE